MCDIVSVGGKDEAVRVCVSEAWHAQNQIGNLRVSPQPSSPHLSNMLRSFRQTLPPPVSIEKQLSQPFRTRAILPRRLRASLFVALAFVATFAIFHRRRGTITSLLPPTDDTNILDYLQGLPEPEDGSDPPRFYGWHDREKLLPQLDPDLPFPQGREGRYIYFANQACCAPSRVPLFSLESRLTLPKNRHRLGQRHAGDAPRSPPRTPLGANVRLFCHSPPGLCPTVVLFCVFSVTCSKTTPGTPSKATFPTTRTTGYPRESP